MSRSAQSSSDEIGLTIPGYKFWIEIDGKKAKQYQIEHDDDVMSCYIASEVDKEFSIVVQKDQFEAMDIHYYLHDDCIKRLFLAPERHGSQKLSHTHTGSGKQKLVFSNINYADDEQMSLSSVPENLGMIRLMLYPVLKFKRRGRREPNIFDFKDVSTMSEKTKSVGFHSISLQPPEIKNERPRYHQHYKTYRVNPAKPWYTIKFIYRSLAILQAQGIAPEAGRENVSNDPQDDQNLEKPLFPKVEPTEGKPSKQPCKKTHKMEASQIMKTIETIIIEDSNSEDDGRSEVKVEKITGSKRPRTSLKKSVHSKRLKTDLKSDPDIIILDSD